MNTDHPDTIDRPVSPAFSRQQSRAVVLLGAGQLLISTTLLLLAATRYWEQPPRWGQFLDVVLAFTVVLTGIWIDRLTGSTIPPQSWRRSYRIATYIPVLVLIGLWLAHRQFDFNFLTGVAWRTWLLMYVLPAALALWRKA